MAILSTVLLQLLHVLLLGVLLLGVLLLGVLLSVLLDVLRGVLLGVRVSHSSVCLVHEARRTTVDGGTGRGRPSHYIARSQPRRPMLLPMKLLLAVLLLLLLAMLLLLLLLPVLPVLPVASDSTPRIDKI